MAEQLVGALGPISKGEVVRNRREPGGWGRVCDRRVLLSCHSPWSRWSARGGWGGSPQQMALDKGVGWGVWPSAPGAACELLPLSTERKELGAGKGCFYSEGRISTHPHPPIHRLEPGKKAAGRGAREAKVRTASNSHHLPWKTWGQGAPPSHENGPKAHLDGGRILLTPNLRIQGCSLRIRELTPGAQRTKARN